MSRIFLSHAREDGRQARALKQWLSEQDPPLATEIFLDTDRQTGIPIGTRWQDELKRASGRCEAVICLLSRYWENSVECRVEYRTAENLGKQIFPARLEPEPEGGSSITGEWQRCDLFGDGHQTLVDLGDGQEPVAFLTDGLLGLRDGIRGAGISAESFAWPPKDEPHRAPYRGWDPMEEVDAGVFFGRDVAIVKGMDALRNMRHKGTTLFVILGPSGAGKSSFLRAGLLPRLRKEDRRFLVLDIVRPQRAVLTGTCGLAAAVFSTRTKLGLEKPDLGEIKRLCRTDANRVRDLLIECQHAAADRLPDLDDSQHLPTVVLPLDQAEELFVPGLGGEAHQFLDLVKKLALAADDARLGLIVAVTIRTDCYQPMQTAAELENVSTEVFGDLKPMQPYSFKEVITGPAQRSKASDHPFMVAPELVDKLVEDCAEGTDTLPLLSLTLYRLYQDYSRDGVITVDEYENDLGGMNRVVQVEINDILADDPQERQEQLNVLREAFIPWLVTIGVNDQPMRRRAYWTDLPPTARPLLDKFVAKRLLVKDAAGDRTVVEVTLEHLLTEWNDLRGWLADEAPNLRSIDALERDAVQWEASGRQTGYLLPEVRLKEAERLAASPGYGGRLTGVHHFLTASTIAVHEQLQADLRKEKASSRKLRIALGAVAAVLVIAIVCGGIAWYMANLAEARYREAVSLRLVSEAESMLAGSRSEGDARAFQQLLAARTLTETPDDGAVFSAAVRRLNTRKIINAPAVVRGVAFSPDNKHIASASIADKTVRIWDADSGQPVGTSPVLAHHDKVFAVAFSPDGRTLVTASADKTLQRWDAATAQPIGAPLVGHTGEVYSVAFSPDGRYIVSGSADQTLLLWDARTAIPLGAPLRGHTGAVWSVAFSPDGRRIVSGSGDRTIQRWDVAKHAPDGPPITGHSDIVWSVAFSPDGRRIVSGSGDTTVRQWDSATGNPVGPLISGHSNAVFGAVFNADGHRIVSGSADNTVRLWDADSGQPIGVPLEGHNNAVMGVAFSPDSARIVSGSTDNTVRVWDALNVQPGGYVVGVHTGAVQGVAFSPDSSQIVSAGDDNMIRVWMARATRPVGTPMAGHLRQVVSVAFSRDGARIVSGGADGAVRLWDAVRRQPVGPILRGHEGSVLSVAVSEHGDRVVSAGTDGTVRVWDAVSGTEILRLVNAHNGQRVSCVAINAAGDRIVTGGFDEMVRLWDMTGRPVGAPMTAPGLNTSHDGAVTSVAFSPDGSRVVSASIDTTERVWDVGSGAQMRVLTGHQGSVTSVAFSADGRRIASASVDRTVRLWDALTGKQFGQPMRGHQNWVLSVAFSPDGRFIASSSGDGTIRLWPAEVGDNDLCDKLTSNMSHEQWNEWVAPDIPYVTVCRDLPVTAD